MAQVAADVIHRGKPATKNAALCPVCRSSNLREKAAFSAAEAAQTWIVAEGDRLRHDALRAHIETLWGGKRCVIKECLDCRFGFADPFVGGDERFYDLAFPRGGYPADRFEFRRTRDVIEREGLTGPLLEVGSGPGHFLRLVSPSLLAPDQVTALEYVPSCVEAVRSRGHEAIQGDLRTSLGSERRFGIVCMFQAIEHIDDPDSIFLKLHQLVRPGGHLFISVPNQDRVEWDEAHNSLQDTPPNHVGRWRVESFQAIAGRLGFELIEHETNKVSRYDFAKLDLFYSYLRSSQRKGTFANWTRAQRPKPGGKFIGLAGAAFHVPVRLRYWLGMRSLEGLGDTLWVHLRKPSC